MMHWRRSKAPLYRIVRIVAKWRYGCNSRPFKLLLAYYLCGE
jgi:hypothetical protein